jgi:hypothetical protein
MKNVKQDIAAWDMRRKLETLEIATAHTNRFITALDHVIKGISLVRASPDQIREANRQKLLKYSKRRR